MGSMSMSAEVIKYWLHYCRGNGNNNFINIKVNPPEF